MQWHYSNQLFLYFLADIKTLTSQAQCRSTVGSLDSLHTGGETKFDSLNKDSDTSALNDRRLIHGRFRPYTRASGSVYLSQLTTFFDWEPPPTGNPSPASAQKTKPQCKNGNKSHFSKTQNSIISALTNSALACKSTARPGHILTRNPGLQGLSYLQRHRKSSWTHKYFFAVRHLLIEHLKPYVCRA